MFDTKADVDARGGEYINALQAASVEQYVRTIPEALDMMLRNQNGSQTTAAVSSAH